MVCIYCSGLTNVINSRPHKRVNQVWRRRQCSSCQAVFSTWEKIDYSSSLMVRSDSHPELAKLERDWLYISLYKSLEHRKMCASDASALTDTCLAKIVETAEGPIVEASNIIKIVRDVLERFDQAAAVHYQAFHSSN